MKKIVAFVLIFVAMCGGIWMSKAWTFKKQPDDKVLKFNADADNLILGIQQYKEFVGSYPMGNNASITKALLGRGDKRVMILAVSKTPMNDKGEILDPWGTPLAFYFGNNEVLIRSAGPNRIWEDSAITASDDLYRSASIDKLKK